MKIKFLFIFLLLGVISRTNCQNSLEFTFNAVNIESNVQLDSIRIINRTQGGENMIYYPNSSISLEIVQGDLLLFIGYANISSVDIQEYGSVGSSFKVFQNYPNPMAGQSEISMYLPQEGKLVVLISDLLGRLVIQKEWNLDNGHHSFKFLTGDSNLYSLTAYFNGTSQSIKMISTGYKTFDHCQLEYLGVNQRKLVGKTSPKGNDSAVSQSGILDSPSENQTYIFQFATNIPCPEIPTVDYGGRNYNTIQIFSQCWLKENLNVGSMISGSQNQSNNGIIEKYCYDNNTNICDICGGLYQWNEMMQYSTEPGTRGICPPGWHIPTDEEWMVLEGAVDSEYGIGDPEWDRTNYRGYDAGANLKSDYLWENNGNGNDLFGFTGLPCGIRYGNGQFADGGYVCDWLSSNTGANVSSAYDRYLNYGYSKINRATVAKHFGYSVRCIKD